MKIWSIVNVHQLDLITILGICQKEVNKITSALHNNNFDNKELSW